MAEPPIPGRPDWRQGKTSGPARPAGQRGWQHKQPAATPPTPASLRAPMILGLVLLLGVVLCGFLGWWLIPVRFPPVHLALCGAGYEDNLNLPHNAYGMNGLRELARIPSTSWLNVGLRTPLDSDQGAWKKAWSQIHKEAGTKSLVLFLALHGADTDDEPYFFLDDKAAHTKLTLSELLKSLEDIDQRTPILLILEPAQVSTYWPAGMLHNDFVTKLKAMKAQLKDDHPNLLIMCASSEGEVSWANEEWGHTVFTHFLLKALKGGAQEEKISVQQLFDTVQDKVKNWSRYNRGVTQTPILLGDEQWAEKFELMTLPHLTIPDSRPPDLPPKLDKVRQEVVTLRDQVPFPAVYSPQLWRYYLDLSVRYEQLARAGSPAPKIITRLDEIAQQLRDRARTKDASPTIGWSLPMPAVLGMAPPGKLRPFAAGALKQLESATNEKAAKAAIAKIEQQALKLFDGQAVDRSIAKTLIRGALQRALLAKLEQDITRQDLAEPAKGKIGLVLDQLHAFQDRAAQSHLLVMLLQDLDTRQPPSDTLLQQALRVGRLAEETALTAPSAPAAKAVHPYAEVVFPWVRKEVDDADAQRRRGEGWLFAPEDQHTHAKRELDAAEKGFAIAAAKTEELRAALDLRDRALADLPYFAQWAATRRDPPPEHGPKDIDELVRKLSDGLKLLIAQLQAPAALGQLGKTTKAVDTSYQDLHSRLRNEYGRLQEHIDQHERWHQTEAILGLPLLVNGTSPVDAAVSRAALLERSRAMAHQWNQDEDAKALGDIREARAIRELRKQMVRAALSPYAILEDRPLDTNFHLRTVMDEMNDTVRKGAEPLEPADAVTNLTQADLLCRGMLSSEPIADRRDTVSKLLRVVRMNDLLVWQADRTAYDHWFADARTAFLGETYYQKAAKAYLGAARQLVVQGVDNKFHKFQAALTAPIADRLKELAKPDKLQSAAVTERYWLAPGEQPLTWTVGKDNGKYHDPFGVAVAWLQLDEPKRVGVTGMKIKSGKSVADGRIALDGLMKEARETVTATVARKPGADTHAPVTGKFVALYRGHKSFGPVSLLTDAPDIIIRRETPTGLPQLAVKMDPKAVCFLIDCSSSMTEIYKDGKTRFSYAMNALEEALRHLPDETMLSIVRFMTPKAEPNPGGLRVTTYEYGRRPSAWYQQRDLEELMTRLRALEKEIHPNDSRSPIARAIAKARDMGFDRTKPEPKVIIALTDGDDNQTSADEDEGYLSEGDNAKYIKSYLKRQFRQGEIELRVVCFLDPKENKASKAEAARAAAQFSGVKDLEPQGGFHPAATEIQLRAEMIKAIRPVLYLPRANVDDPFEIPGRFKGESPDWKRVPAAEYRPYLHELALKQRLQLNKGDKMLLQIAHSGPYRLRRALVTDELSHKKTKDGWTVGLPWHVWDPRGDSGEKRLEQVVTLERTPKEDRDFIEQRRPKFLWIETKPLEGPPPPLLQWQWSYDFPAPAYKVEVVRWQAKKDDPREPVAARTDLWWTDDQPRDEVAYPLRVPLDARFEKTVADVGISGAKVSIDAVELTKVPEIVGGPPKDCIVVRLSNIGDEKKRFFVEVTDLRIAGEEHQYFSSIGCVTAKFWPSQPLREIDLRILSVDAIKRSPLVRHVPFDRLEGKIPELIHLAR